VSEDEEHLRVVEAAQPLPEDVPEGETYSPELDDGEEQIDKRRQRGR